MAPAIIESAITVVPGLDRAVELCAELRARSGGTPVVHAGVWNPGLGSVVDG